MASLRRGEWSRAAFTGVELDGKVAGILGLGKIGVLVAERLAAFGMTVIAYDPYVAAARASQLGVRLAGLDELLAEADFISVHLPRTPETIGLLGDRELHLVRPQVRIVNAARGGIVDEAALASALRGGPGGRSRAGCLRHASPAPTARCSASQRRRHPASGGQHGRGSGEGRDRRGPVGPARAGRRVRARTP